DLRLTLRLSDLGLGFESDLLTFLQSEGRFYLRVAIRLGLADLGIPFHLGRAAFTESIKVALVVGDLLDRESIKPDTHFFEIAGGLGRQLLCERLAIVVDLFNRQGAQDGPEVAFERLEY